MILIIIITDHVVKDFFVATLASWPAHGSAMRSAGRAATPHWNATSRWLLAALPPFGHHRLLAPVLSLPYVTMPTVSGLARSLGQDDNGVTPILWGCFRMVPILHLVSEKRQPFQHASWPRLVAFINSDMVAISNKESRTSREACRSIRQRVLQRILLKWFSYNLLALDQSGHMNNKQLNYCKTVYHILYKWLNDCLFQVDPDIGFRTCPQDISQGMTLVWLVQAMNGPMTLTLPSIQCALTLPVALLGKAVRWHDIWNREIWIITNQKGCGCLDVWP